jgi:predicted ATPase
LVEPPEILVFAGPNGSGKSTVTPAWEKVGWYINADDIKATRGCSDLEAAQEAERLREFCLSERRSFTFETVLSTERNLDLLMRAKAAGFHIESVFVLTAEPELNVFRVKRVSLGFIAMTDPFLYSALSRDRRVPPGTLAPVRGAPLNDGAASCQTDSLLIVDHFLHQFRRFRERRFQGSAFGKDFA